MDPGVGSRIGPYEVLARLGAGGMGEVFRARDARLGREVAIKLLAERGADPGSVERFQQEARLAGALNHPNVLVLYDVGEHDGRPYLVSELLEGETLRERLRGGPIAEPQAIAYARQVAHGFEAAHEKGIVHRDIKPENLFITRDDRIKILDFGIAKLAAPQPTLTDGQQVLTQPGVAIGTPGYMSPELLIGDEVDERADLFAFGCVLHEIVSGARPFVGRTPQELNAAILHERPAPLPASVTPDLARVIERCLEKKPALRFQSARELSKALEQVAIGERPASLWVELRRRRVIRALVAYGIAAFALIQVTEPILHGLHLPDALLSYVVVILALGFPIVAALAWAFDVRDGRLRRTAGAGIGARRAAALAVLGLAVALPGLLWYLRPGRGAPASAPAGQSPSVAVLPFISLNTGEEASLFADGIHGELLTQLSKIGDLKVISRTSVLQYRTGVRNVREIGDSLGVASVLEGSVQRAGNRVRIEVRLSDVKSDRQIWADSYDRDLTDVFAIQTAVTEEIAHALSVRLSPEEKSRIARVPTRNAEAHEFYLRGQEYESRPNRLPGDFRIAEQLYRKAIELDPGYALAHAQLSYLETSKFYWFQADASDARLLDARLEAERAMALDPDLAESHVATGYVDYVQRDFRKAVKEFERALQLDGNNVTVLTTLGYAERRLGAFEEYLRHERKAAQLDPHSTVWPEDIALGLTILRRYEEAERLFDGVLARTPDSEVALIDKSRLMLLWKGDDRLAKEILSKLPAGIDSSGNLTLNKYVLDLMKLYPQQASAALAPASIVFFTARTAAFPRAFIEALAAAVDGDSSRAAAQYNVARVQLEAKVKEHPDEWRFRTALGRVYAGLGRKADAIREGVKAVELLPVSKDAVDGPSMLEELAAVYAQVGEPDQAIEIVERLLSIPAFLSAPLLRIDAKWASLRQDPRFRKLAGL